MDNFSENSPAILNASDDWLRRRQGLALPVIPPTTPEARRFFFSEIAKHAAAASAENKKQINFVAFAQEWNRSADGKSRFYITPEVLIAYAKTWERNSNIKASTDLIADAVSVITQTSHIFAASNNPFPEYLTAAPTSDQPHKGLLEDIAESSTVPASISTTLAASRPAINTPGRPSIPPGTSSAQPLLPEIFSRISGSLPHIDAHEHSLLRQSPTPESTPVEFTDTILPPDQQPPAKRRRIVSENERRRTVRKCRRCGRPECPGGSNIFNCPVECTRPCNSCGQTTRCRGVDNGKNCTYGRE